MYSKRYSKKRLYVFLEEQYAIFNKRDSISATYLDPLLIAREFRNEKIALVCALFAYGNVRAILNFLKSCPLEKIATFKALELGDFTKPYRFQNQNEIFAFFCAITQIESLEQIFLQGYKKGGIIEGIAYVQAQIYKQIEALGVTITKGLVFLLGQKITNNNTSPLKRWNLFLRWMVRKDALDLGLWSGIDPKDLLLPLDTHTFRVAQKLGLLKRKTYDFKAVLEVSKNLKALNPKDPIKYDFALYRIGQFNRLS